MYVKSKPTRKPQRSAERRTNPQRTAATRAALIDAARRLFIDRGYADTSTPEIVAAADVTRGALYHHFEDKRALFRAVVEAELSAVAGEIEQSSDPGGSPFEALVAGTDAYFRAMRSTGRTRLLLVEAPAVFGWAGLYEIDDKHGTRTLREGLAAAMDAGTIRPLPLDALTILMAALFDRGALAIDAGGEAAEVRAVVVAVFEGLRTADVRPARKRR